MAEKRPKSGSPKPIPRQKIREGRKSEAASSSVREPPPLPPPVVHPECPVCLQPCIHPVKVPCGHVFCFLCVKGAANQSQRCALCRQAIPPSFLECPTLLNDLESVSSSVTPERYAWFYEGRNGWWQYDERTNHEIEDGYRSKKRSFELLIAGYVYIIDLDNMSQMRRSDPSRRRRIKRDLLTATKKGIAGLKIPQKGEDEDEEAAGGEEESSQTVKSESEDSQPTANEHTEVYDQRISQNVSLSSDLSPEMSGDQLNERLGSLSLAINQESLPERSQIPDPNDENDTEEVIEI
ncbi:E3 ubiquitin-protein ligase rnf146-like isoform X2 [Apostichopus japonicus]|uniref:E3 ubiquitin-protein ligase rnf146-like isoform X2 n=1 Tax=Stichopus japonicus TaxID=307972 RepID=UPI003AB668DE